MTDFTIPCEVVARLSAVALAPRGAIIHNEWFKSIRIDNGIAVACNGPLMAVEYIGGNAGIVHIPLDDAIVAQCKTEQNFKSSLHIAVNETLRFAAAKTTLGWAYPGNAAIWSAAENKLADWRKVLPIKMPDKSRGGMFMNAEILAILAASSPSGRIVFAEHIDRDVATIIRDTYDDKWFGVWIPHNTTDGPDYEPATIPGWAR